MSRHGEVASAGAFHGWCSRVLGARASHIRSLVERHGNGERPAAEEMLPTRFTLDGEDGTAPWWDFQLDGYGTWLWALHAHLSRHGLPVGQYAAAVQLTTDYLTSFWDTPCFDWWEEHPDQVHVSTLGAIHGGLSAALNLDVLDAAATQEIEGVLDAISQLVVSRGTHDGHLAKWLDSRAVDASLLACIVPFGLVDPAGEAGRATLVEVATQLAPGLGTHRYLRRHLLRRRAVAASDRLPGLVPRRRRRRHGRRPMPGLDRDPGRRRRPDPRAGRAAPAGTGPPRRMGGTVGTGRQPAAVVARDVPDPGRRAGGARMIRHRPHGSGHAYEESGDQRVPALPLVGEAVELRAHAAPAVRAIVAEWDDGRTPVDLELAPRAASTSRPTPADQADPTTHLAQAQARTTGTGSWSVRTPVLEGGRRYRYRFQATDVHGRQRRTRWFELSAAQWVPQGGELAVHGEDRVVPGSLEWLVDADGARRVRFDLPLAVGEHVVGFGERFDAVDQRGRRLDAVVFEQYKNQGALGRTYLPMPFAMVLGGDGWSFHLRTSRRTWYDVGVTQPDRIRIEADLGGSPTERLDLVLSQGEPAQLLDRFLAEAGRPEILPPWVFRLWASGNEWNTQARVTAVAQRHLDEDIPFGALVIEAWSNESTFYAFRDAEFVVHEDSSPHRLADFTFREDGAWPDPKAMVDALHKRDVRVLLWQIPLLKMRPHPRGQAAVDARVAVERGLVVTRDDGKPYRNRGWWFPLALMPDLTSAEVRDWWAAKRRYLVRRWASTGSRPTAESTPGELTCATPTAPTETSPTTCIPCTTPRPMAISSVAAARPRSRSAGPASPGPKGTGVFWAGDEDSTWDAFRHSVTAGITASACGIVYWGWDLAGFSGEVPDAELYLRAAAAMACFAPIMQYHSEYNHHRKPLRDRTPWNIGDAPGTRTYSLLFRRYAHLRERLVPYLADQAAAGLASGLPLMRGLFFADPRDGTAWDHPGQYLLGDDLLVAPVTSPEVTTWPVYLPAGDWVDAWSGERASGPLVLQRSVPIDEIPVYCRADRWPSMEAAFRGLP